VAARHMDMDMDMSMYMDVDMDMYMDVDMYMLCTCACTYMLLGSWSPSMSRWFCDARDAAVTPVRSRTEACALAHGVTDPCAPILGGVPP